MYKFSKRSQIKLNQCHPDIIKIMNEVIKSIDISILEGARNEERQNDLYYSGRSKLEYPNSKHNVTKKDPLSLAIDVAPYPIDWDDHKRFFFLAGFIKATAWQLLERGEISHTVIWGGDWNNNNNFKDQSFFDAPHFELAAWVKI